LYSNARVLSANAENNALTAPIRESSLSSKKLDYIDPETSNKTTTASVGSGFDKFYSTTITEESMSDIATEETESAGYRIGSGCCYYAT
jgi:hypothetical protein